MCLKWPTGKGVAMTEKRNTGKYCLPYELGRLSSRGLLAHKRLVPVVALPENGGRFARERERIKIIAHLLRGGTLAERPFNRLFEAEREVVRAQAVAFLFWRAHRAPLQF